MSHVTFNAGNLKDVELMQMAEQILTKMNQEAALFPTPTPDLHILDASLDAFRHAATEASHRDGRAILIRRYKRDELVYLIKELSKYVDTISRGDITVILAAGFTGRKSRNSYNSFVHQAQRPIATPAEIGSGRVKVKTERWVGARMYEFQFRLKEGDGAWHKQLCSKSTCIIEGLQSFKEYEFRVTYIGIDPRPNYSDVTSSFVL